MGQESGLSPAMASAFRAGRHRHHAALLGLIAGHLRCGSSRVSASQPAQCASTSAERPEFAEDGSGRPLNQAARDLFAAATGADVPPPSDSQLRSHAAAVALLEGIPAVEIANGTWKYVQIELRVAAAAPEKPAEPPAGAAARQAGGIHGRPGAADQHPTRRVLTKRVVRSVRGAKYHADSYRSAMQRILAEHVPRSFELSAGVLSGVVIGGGRIRCDDGRGTATVYGGGHKQSAATFNFWNISERLLA